MHPETWIEFCIHSNHPLLEEWLPEELSCKRGEGLIVEDHAVRVFLRSSSVDQPIEKLIEALAKKLNMILPAESDWREKIESKPVEDTDWVARWRTSLGQVRAGERIVIVPPGVTFQPRFDDIILSIEPKMAFGTGDHATTRLALSLLEKTDLEGSHILDLGCGNGILSLAALMMGAERTTAVDFEWESMQEAVENLENHGVLKQAEVICGDVLHLPFRGKYDLIVGNILFSPIRDGLPTWVSEYLSPDGKCILTGLREGLESKHIEEMAADLGLIPEFTLVEDGWYAARFCWQGTCSS